MKIGSTGLGVAMIFAPLLAAQPVERLHVDWDRFAERATDRTEVTIDGGMIRTVSKFLNSDGDKDSKDLQKLLSGLRGVYVHTYTFEHAGDYPEAEVENIRRQLRDAHWGKIVSSVKREEGEQDEIYLKNVKNDGDATGLVVLAAEPREFTLVEIAGKIDPRDLDRLNGALHFRKYSDDGDRDNDKDEKGDKN